MQFYEIVTLLLDSCTEVQYPRQVTPPFINLFVYVQLRDLSETRQYTISQLYMNE